MTEEMVPNEHLMTEENGKPQKMALRSQDGAMTVTLLGAKEDRYLQHDVSTENMINICLYAFIHSFLHVSWLLLLPYTRKDKIHC